MSRALTARAIAAIRPVLPTTHAFWLTTRCRHEEPAQVAGYGCRWHP